MYENIEQLRGPSYVLYVAYFKGLLSKELLEFFDKYPRREPF